MLKLDLPEKLHFESLKSDPDWKQRFERFRCATKLDKEDEVLQVNSLISIMGKEAQHIIKAFTFAEVDENKYVKVICHWPYTT